MKNWLSCCFPGRKEDLIKEKDFVDVDNKDQKEMEKKDQENVVEVSDKKNEEEKDNLKADKKPDQNSPSKHKEEDSNNTNNNKSIKNNNDKENQPDNNNDKNANDKKTENDKDKDIKDNNDNKNPDDNKSAKVKESKKDVEKLDPVSDIVASNREISQNDLKAAGKLILSEFEGDIFYGKKLEITAAGLVGGRNKNDGVVIFGSAIQDEEQEKENFKPDFELNYKEKTNYPYIFSIYYEKNENKFYIRSYSGKGSDNRILFVKLKGNMGIPLNQKEIISAGNIIFQITPLENNYLEVVNLSRKELSIMPKQTFDASVKKEVTIGRHKNCDFSFPKDKSFSRYQTTLEFDENLQKWIIKDGGQNKPSTNGTWVFGTHSFEIQDGMIVEILTSKIKIDIIKE